MRRSLFHRFNADCDKALVFLVFSHGKTSFIQVWFSDKSLLLVEIALISHTHTTQILFAWNCFKFIFSRWLFAVLRCTVNWFYSATTVGNMFVRFFNLKSQKCPRFRFCGRKIICTFFSMHEIREKNLFLKEICRFAIFVLLKVEFLFPFWTKTIKLDGTRKKRRKMHEKKFHVKLKMNLANWINLKIRFVCIRLCLFWKCKSKQNFIGKKESLCLLFVYNGPKSMYVFHVVHKSYDYFFYRFDLWYVNASLVSKIQLNSIWPKVQCNI